MLTNMAGTGGREEMFGRCIRYQTQSTSFMEAFTCHTLGSSQFKSSVARFIKIFRDEIADK